MGIRHFPLIVLIAAAGHWTAIADEPDQSKPLHQALKRSVDYLQRQGTAWIDERHCVSCHQIPAMLRSLREANARGLFADDDKLAGWTDWSLKIRSWAAPPNDDADDKVAANNVDTMVQLILGYPGSLRNAADGRQVASFVKHILAAQNDDGSWNAGGQLPGQKRTPEESHQVTTMWTLLALDDAIDTGPAIEESRGRALEWLARTSPGDSTEWWVARWLVARRFGDSPAAQKFFDALMDGQHDDGGWGWLVADDSDALGTGLALYAMAQAGRPADDPAVQRARRFLLDTQQDDGSWPVKSTLKRHKDKVIPTSAYLGTAWASIGLMSMIPPD